MAASPAPLEFIPSSICDLLYECLQTAKTAQRRLVQTETALRLRRRTPPCRRTFSASLSARQRCQEGTPVAQTRPDQPHVFKSLQQHGVSARRSRSFPRRERLRRRDFPRRPRGMRSHLWRPERVESVIVTSARQQSSRRQRILVSSHGRLCS